MATQHEPVRTAPIIVLQIEFCAPRPPHISSRAGRQAGTIRTLWIRLVLFAIGAAALATPAIADATPSFTLRYGVLAGLTGDPAPSGQGWNEAATLGIDTIAQTLKSMGLNSIQVLLADSQDSHGNPQAGVEAAQKLVQIDDVNVIIGDFYSSVTTAVSIPNQVLIFTGGTSPALIKLNTGPVPLVWQPVATFQPRLYHARAAPPLAGAAVSLPRILAVLGVFRSDGVAALLNQMRWWDRWQALNTALPP